MHSVLGEELLQREVIQRQPISCLQIDAYNKWDTVEEARTYTKCKKSLVLSKRAAGLICKAKRIFTRELLQYVNARLWTPTLTSARHFNLLDRVDYVISLESPAL